MNIVVYYDGECPFCSRFVRLLRLRETGGSVELVDLRTALAKRQEFADAGIDVNKGMVVELDDRRFFGADAAHALALLSTPSGLFNRLNRWILGTPFLARTLYPILRMGRAATLAVLGRKGMSASDHAPHSEPRT